MSPTLTTFLFEAVNFLVLAGVLGWLFFKPVRAVLEARKTELQQQSQTAVEKLADAERLRAEQQEREAAFQLDVDRLREEAKAAARKDADAIRADARAAADRERDRLRGELASLQDAELEELAGAVAAASADFVSTLLHRVSGADLDAALIRAASEELEQLDTSRMAPVTIESARPLTDHERDTLLNLLGNAAETADLRVSPSLRAGIRVSTSCGLVDASLKGIAGYARRAITERLREHSETAPPHDPAGNAETSDAPSLLPAPDRS